MGKTGMLNLQDMMKENWWVKFRRYRRFPYSYLTIVITACIMYLPMFFSVWAVDAKNGRTLHDLTTVYLNQNHIPLYVCYSLGCIISAVLNWKIKTLGEESLGIIRELRGKICVLFLFTFYLVLNAIVPVDFQRKYFRPQSVALWVAYLLEVYVTLLNIVFVVLRDEKMKRKRAKKIEQARRRSHSESSANATPAKPVKLKLETILQTPELLELFRDFLTRELSLEHLLFIEAVLKFHEQFTEALELEHTQKAASHWGQFVSQAQQIYHDFVDESGLAPVNVSFSCRSTIAVKIQQISREIDGVLDPDLFKCAYIEVYRVLALDSLSRFKRDPKMEQYAQQFAPSTGGSSAVTSGTSGHSLTERDKENKLWPPKHKRGLSMTATKDTRRVSLTSVGISHSADDHEFDRSLHKKHMVKKASVGASGSFGSPPPSGGFEMSERPSRAAANNPHKKSMSGEQSTVSVHVISPNPSPTGTSSAGPSSPSLGTESASATPRPTISQDDQVLRASNPNM
eukprot:TRINITY_DN5262_c0_g1_i1.p1 TRINITY_DN5262_c0_g1~~TRINITY_DN5262_c0_g1_i1.p1  ORF type:complete len:576 (-),score=120.96 TRINITY_DN5262_c0_g1_i1:116-1654(-)